MTTQEMQMLQGLTSRINNTPLSEKDPDAERFLQDTLGRNPDALYILAQTALVQQYALEQAQKQLSDARAQLQQATQQPQQPKHATSFLGNLLGLSDEPARPAPPPPPTQQYSQPPFTPVQSYAPSSYAAPAATYGAPQSGSFLRSAMQTATGVAAGALAFEGIESLMHGFGGASGFSSGMGGGRPEEIVNNYYGDTPGHEHTDHLSSDIDDRRGESSSFADAVSADDHHDGRQGLMDDDSSDSGVDDSMPSDDNSSDSAGDDSMSSDDDSYSNDDSNS